MRSRRQTSASCEVRRASMAWRRPLPSSSGRRRPGGPGAPMPPSISGPSPAHSRNEQRCRMPNKLRFLMDTLATPIGELVLMCDEEGRLRATDWTQYDDRMHRLLDRHYGAEGYTLTSMKDPFGLTTALAAYFDGDLHAIDAL